MTDIQEQELNNSLQAFLEKKGPQENSALEQAQRLVNLYHHLSAFGSDFTKEYNKMLLEASPDVQTMLGSIIGGQNVREYLDFLKKKQIEPTNKSEKNAEDSDTSLSEGYMPTPENDFSANFIFPPNTTGTNDSSLQLNAFMKTIVKMQHAEAERQSAFLQQALEKMQSVLLQQIQNPPPPANEPNPNLLDQSQIINQTIEKVVKAQTDVMVKAFQKASENTREIAARQTNRLMDYLKKLEKEEDHYSDVIETSPQQISSQMLQPETLTTPAPIIPHITDDAPKE